MVPPFSMGQTGDSSLVCPCCFHGIVILGAANKYNFNDFLKAQLCEYGQTGGLISIKNRVSILIRRKAFLIYFGFSKKEWTILSIFFLSGLIISLALCGRLPLTSYARGIAVKVVPGEFEHQQSIWIMWPSEVYNTEDSPVRPVMADIVEKLAPHVPVDIMANSKFEAAQIEKLLTRHDCPVSRIRYYIVNHQTIWARDVGPLFVKDKHGRLCVVNFKFNNYGRQGDYYYINTEGQVDVQVGKILKIPVIDSDMVSEGGSIESNGKGTIILTESVALKHNDGLTKKQIEDEYKRVLGVRKIIWLKNGLAEDKVTGGHVDEFARFADPNTILLAEILPIDQNSSPLARRSHMNLEEDYKILVRATDQDGNPFRIIRIPMPPTLYKNADEKKEIPVRSYMNYVVTNGAVLVQTYWKPGRSDVLKVNEEEVLDTFKNVFPGREIIRIDAENINAWGGGVHCVTQHMPAVN